LPSSLPPKEELPRPAELILEAMQSENGVFPTPTPWLKGVGSISQAAQVQMIVDEVQSGFGWTGCMFAFEYVDITPDVIVLSKMIGAACRFL